MLRVARRFRSVLEAHYFRLDNFRTFRSPEGVGAHFLLRQKTAGALELNTGPRTEALRWSGFSLRITGKDSAVTKLEGPPLGAQRRFSDDPPKYSFGDRLGQTLSTEFLLIRFSGTAFPSESVCLHHIEERGACLDKGTRLGGPVLGHFQMVSRSRP